ncbi:MAG: histidinol-phosphate transaminase [Clostridia bacterium]|nr:histidinol-phosphate transaminase [Clostridia bacterium]
MLDNMIPQKVREIEEYTPNTDICKIRLDANESPFNPSDEVLNEFKKVVSEIDFNRYPDPFAKELIESFAKIYKVDPKNVVAGNGSDELISLICGNLTENEDTVAVVSPDFSMYEFYSSLAGAQVISFGKDEKFQINFEKLTQVVNEKRSKIVIFSNPCNPTGALEKRDDIIKFIKNVNAFVIVDEAYMEFSPVNESVLDLCDKFENLIVLKTTSKAYGAAALRLGFAISNEEIAKTLRKIKSPYNVNTVSQIYGKIILNHYHEIEARVREIKANTVYLREEIKKIENSSIETIYETSTNFVLLKMKTPELAVALHKKLKEKSIAIRCMAKGGFIRITAGKREEIDELLAKMREVIL